MRKFVYCIAILFFTFPSFAQDNLDSLMNSMGSDEPTKVFATFKATKIIGAQTTETVKKGTLDFRITHRFGNIGAKSGGGGHTAFGFDDAQDIRFSFDYGICEKLAVGIARNKRFENIDGTVKWRFLDQKSKGTPVSICLYGNAAVSPVMESQLYNGVVDTFEHKFAHRMSYTTQLIIARKFNSWLSLELLAGLTHRNFIKEVYNSEGVKDVNDVPSIGFGGRLKMTKRTSFVWDYFYVISDYRSTQPFGEHPISVGFEIETGGHVFHLNYSNSSGIIESDFIPNTTDNWFDGGFKFGFNISRVFTIVKPKM